MSFEGSERPQRKVLRVTALDDLPFAGALGLGVPAGPSGGNGTPTLQDSPARRPDRPTPSIFIWRTHFAFPYGTVVPGTGKPDHGSLFFRQTCIAGCGLGTEM
jgi:hypothetical protein